MSERWKDIPWYEGIYQASNLWRIKWLLLYRGLKNRIRKKTIKDNWYELVTLKNKSYHVHRLIIKTFLWDSKLEVNHKNWIKTDNRLENLEYCTRSENLQHLYKELWFKSKRRKEVIQYTLDMKKVKVWWSLTEASIWTWTHQPLISNVCNWKSKTTWGFIWRY